MREIAPDYILYAAGMIATAAIAWFRVGILEKDNEGRDEQLKEHDERIQRLEQFKAAQEVVNHIRDRGQT